ncbi:MAG: pseudouridine synthase [bacterium]|nr:pseudouridine synthase [bacterium]
MSKFRNSKEGDDKGRSDKPRGGRAASRAGKETEGDKKKKDGYKAKRSFSKNKVFREIGESRGGDRPRRPFGPDKRRPFRKDGDKDEKRSSAPKREFKSSEESKPFREDREKRSTAGGSRPERKFGEKPDRDSPRREVRERDERKPFKKEFRKEGKFEGFKKAGTGFGESSSSKREGPDPKKRRFSKPRKNDETEGSRRVNYEEFEEGRAFSPKNAEDIKNAPKTPVKAKAAGGEELIRLNKYLSNAGIASRREADTLIQSGVVKVNGVVVDQLGYKIKAGDKVTYGDSAVRTERKAYLLLNKPKDYITTMDDPRERKTVMELIAGACKERVYPVGRLDRNTTGLLLFTNDGEMTTKLTHPKFGVKKVYHVSLNKGLRPEDFKAIIEGVELEDGTVKADDLAFVGEGKKEVGIEIHSGKNRVVRRLFEHLGYDVIKLDRVVFAGLTKKDLPRGKHRFLTAKEISFLQMIG